ncbi:replication protein [Chitinimonas sp. PSY-7]|uniref:replication protein n=1 Tax=Chitinimonas sp. PSY-7 TaxID=3459088 RepID=UPI0040402D21
MSTALRLVHSSERTTQPAPYLVTESFMAIPNALFDALLVADIPARQLKVALAIARKTYGYGKQQDDCTITTLAAVAGINRSDASRALQALITAKIVSASKGKHGYLVSLNSPEMWDLGAWQNTTESTTNVAKCHAQPWQNATHNKQPQNTSIPSSLRSEVSATADEPIAGKVKGKVTVDADPVATTQAVEPSVTLAAEPVRGMAAKVQLDPARLVEAYHAACPTLPRVKLLTDSRKQALRHRWVQAGKELGRYGIGDVEAGMAWWTRFFTAVGESDFLSGKSGAWGQCSFDWLLKQTNFVKVVEGNYRNGVNA